MSKEISHIYYESLDKTFQKAQHSVNSKSIKFNCHIYIRSAEFNVYIGIYTLQYAKLSLSHLTMHRLLSATLRCLLLCNMQCFHFHI